MWDDWEIIALAQSEADRQDAERAERGKRRRPRIVTPPDVAHAAAQTAQQPADAPDWHSAPPPADTGPSGVPVGDRHPDGTRRDGWWEGGRFVPRPTSPGRAPIGPVAGLRLFLRALRDGDRAGQP